MGYELSASHFSDEGRDMVRKQMKKYYEMEELVLNEDLYHTENPMGY